MQMKKQKNTTRRRKNVNYNNEIRDALIEEVRETTEIRSPTTNTTIEGKEEETRNTDKIEKLNNSKRLKRHRNCYFMDHQGRDLLFSTLRSKQMR